MNLPKSEVTFPFQAKEDFVLVLSATSLSYKLIFTTLLKACGIQSHSHIFLHQWLMEEYYYPQQAQ